MKDRLVNIGYGLIAVLIALLVAMAINAASDGKAFALISGTGAGVITDSDSNQFRISYGTIRVNSNGWAYEIDDGSHDPLNIDAHRCTSYVSRICVDYPSPLENGTFLAGPDEKLAQEGWSFGASVSASGTATIFCAKENASGVTQAADCRDLSAYSNGNIWVIGMHSE